MIFLQNLQYSLISRERQYKMINYSINSYKILYPDMFKKMIWKIFSKKISFKVTNNS